MISSATQAPQGLITLGTQNLSRVKQDNGGRQPTDQIGSGRSLGKRSPAP